MATPGTVLIAYPMSSTMIFAAMRITGLVPPKGMSLPFISAGLSNLLLMGVLLGVIVNTQRVWGRATLPGKARTMREVMALPEVFSAADCGYPDRLLLANTGCWVCRFDRPWRFSVHFEIRDRIQWRDADGGGWVAQAIPEDWGTAVTIMAMVFGNLGDASGTGVGFTRDPRTGEARFYAEFLPNAQGEDVVAGIRTPLPIEALH